MKNRALVLGTALFALTLTGCGSSSDSSEGSSSEETQSQETTAPEETTSTEEGLQESSSSESASASQSPQEKDSDEQKMTARGNLAMETGDTLTISDPQTGDMAAQVSVEKITPNFTCTGEYSQEPENGQFLALDVTAATGSPQPFENVLYGSFSPGPGSWKFLDEEGVTANSVSSGPAFGCVADSEMVPMDMGPGEKAKGKVILDVPKVQGGTLIFESTMTDGGAEWEVPAK